MGIRGRSIRLRWLHFGKSPTKNLMSWSCANYFRGRGSWAFLIGSYLQLYESLNKHPVEEVSSIEALEAKQ